MNTLYDWILIIISSICFGRACLSIVKRNNSSIANFLNVVTYFFCCLPILLNYLVGLPKFMSVYWYQSFINSNSNIDVARIYDILFSFVMIFLTLYAQWWDNRHGNVVRHKAAKKDNGYIQFLKAFIVSLPVLFIVFSGKMHSFATYTVSSYRGLSEDGTFVNILSELILLSLFVFSTTFFSKKRTKYGWIILILYSGIIAWIQGKRFIIALMLIIYVFLYCRQDLSKNERRKVMVVLPILVLSLFVFSYVYLVLFRPLGSDSFDSVYEMLRVDFGRDNVIKFVIYHEFFINDHILQYPGQTFLSTIFAFVPRAFWPDKPYPHYRYLTAKILNISINNLPAGTTPSWYEMSLANAGKFGYLLDVVFMPILCFISDFINKTSDKLVVMVILVVLLTQSIDSYAVFVLLLVWQFVIRKSKKVGLI